MASYYIEIAKAWCRIRNAGFRIIEEESYDGDGEMKFDEFLEIFLQRRNHSAI